MVFWKGRVPAARVGSEAEVRRAREGGGTGKVGIPERGACRLAGGEAGGKWA